MSSKAAPIDMMYFMCKLLLHTNIKSVKVDKIIDMKPLRTQGHIVKEYIKLIKKTCKHQVRESDSEFMGYTNVNEVYYHIDEPNNEMLVMIIQIDPKDQEIVTIVKIRS